MRDLFDIVKTIAAKKVLLSMYQNWLFCQPVFALYEGGRVHCS